MVYVTVSYRVQDTALPELYKSHVIRQRQISTYGKWFFTTQSCQAIWQRHVHWVSHSLFDTAVNYKTTTRVRCIFGCKLLWWF